MRLLLGLSLLYPALSLLAATAESPAVTPDADNEIDRLAEKMKADIKSAGSQPTYTVAPRKVAEFLPDNRFLLSNRAGLNEGAYYFRGFSNHPLHSRSLDWEGIPANLPGHPFYHRYAPVAAAIPQPFEPRDHVGVAARGTGDLLLSGSARLGAPWVSGEFQPATTDQNKASLLAGAEIPVDRDNRIYARALGAQVGEGDSSQNAALTARWERSANGVDLGVGAYGLRHSFLSDRLPEDERWLYGGRAAFSLLEEGRESRLRTTFALNGDLQRAIDDRFEYRTLGLNLKQEIDWVSWIHTEAGVGLSQIAVKSATFEGDGLAIAPGLSILVSFDQLFDLRLSTGVENRSRDYRALVAGDDTSTRVIVYEARVGTDLTRKLRAEVALFGNNWDSEKIFEPLQNRVVAYPGRSSLGWEGKAKWSPSALWEVNASVVLQSTGFDDDSLGGRKVPGSPDRLISLSATSHLSDRWRLDGAIRHVSERPLTADNGLRGDGFWRGDIGVGYQTAAWSLSAGIENITATAWNEVETVAITRPEGVNAADQCPAGSRGVSDGGGFAGCEAPSVRAGFPFRVGARASLLF